MDLQRSSPVQSCSCRLPSPALAPWTSRDSTNFTIDVSCTPGIIYHLIFMYSVLASPLCNNPDPLSCPPFYPTRDPIEPATSRPQYCTLTDLLHYHLLTIMLSKIQFQRSSEQFQQHLKAGLAYGRIVTTLAELITDKSVCRMNRQQDLNT